MQIKSINSDIKIST